MSIDELSDISCVTTQTVIKRIHEIEGARLKKDGSWDIPDC